MEENIINVIKDVIDNEYFYYSLIGAVVLEIIRSMLTYDGYRKDCELLSQKTRPVGYARNSIDNMFSLMIIVTLGYLGYFALDYMEDPYQSHTQIMKNTKKEDFKPIKQKSSVPIEIKQPIVTEAVTVQPVKYQTNTFTPAYKDINNLKQDIKLLGLTISKLEASVQKYRNIAKKNLQKYQICKNRKSVSKITTKNINGDVVSETKYYKK